MHHWSIGPSIAALTGNRQGVVPAATDRFQLQATGVVRPKCELVAQS